jgi:hypothetical protein
MADIDPLNPPAPPNNPPLEPEPERKRRKVVCEACECTLAMDGGVITVSKKWKDLRDAERTIADLQGRLDTKTQEVEDLKAAGHKPPNGSSDDPSPAPPKKHTAKPLFGGS